jgi:fructosamine-3-kinase
MMPDLSTIEKALGRPCSLIAPLGGDGIYLIRVGRTKYVFKHHQYADVEARMLRLLSPYLKVPEVIWNKENLLVMEYLEENGPVDEKEAASVLASLHNVTQAGFGLDFDTTIGPHHQPNSLSESWVDFYRNERVLSMARRCHEKGRFNIGVMARIETLADRFERLLPEPKPALLHGDIWSGNVIAGKKGIAFIDPAVYYGHNEVELAFILMFHTFGRRFFDVYHGLSPIEKEFFEERQYLYRLYPVLVHVNSFGAGYMGMLERILARFA